ncbi:MAG: response regulator transcription factor [Bacteroidetes bacterium]|nr:response regulator transcription factor [Bacteroidota bacterium]
MGKSFRTVIIDDEQLAIDRLKRLLLPYSESLDLVGQATDGRSGANLIDEVKPDLVFLDVQMPELNGFQVLETIRHQPWIIFTTAYDEFALKAFQTNSIDYLLKPIDKDRLKQAIEKLQRLIPGNEANPSDQIRKLLESLVPAPGKLAKLKIKTGDKIRFVDYSDIVYFEASEKYVEVHTVGETYLIEDTIYQLEEQLKNLSFVRIHRSTLINMDHLLEVVKWFGGKYKVRMKDQKKSELTVSLSYKENLGL